MYDYLVIGAGLSGAVFSRIWAEKNKSILVIDKGREVGGLCQTYQDEVTNILVHKFGPHIFHTSDKEVWNFVNSFCTMIPFIYSPLANSEGVMYNLPVNMNTIKQVFNVSTPAEAKEVIQKDITHYDSPKNFEEACLNKIGRRLYDLFFRSYTEKQWMDDCKNIPMSIFERQSVRYSYDNNYFNDTYQGVPKEGYSKMIKNMLDHPNIDVSLNTEYKLETEIYRNIAKQVVYTGSVDALFNYDLGALKYRTLSIETKIYETDNYQGVCAINWCDRSVKYTRSVEHRFFNPDQQSQKTIVTYETPARYTPGESIPMYPIESDKRLYDKYRKRIPENMTLLGRLGTYKYLDMDKVVRQAMDCGV